MDKQRLRAWGFLLSVGVAVSGLSACGGVGPTYTVEDDATVDQQITSVRLDSDSGGVTLNGGSGTSAVSIHRAVDSPNNAPPGPTHRVENGTLVLSGCGQYCSVNYTVSLPADLPVTGRTSSGEVSLNSVGSVDVTTNSGGVNLNGVDGPTKVETTNGAVRGTGVRGSNVQAKTSNGQIDLTLANPQDVRAETSNGKITLAVPGSSYAVNVQTSNGDQKIDIPNDPAGRYKLDLTTSNGEIAVRPA